MISHLEHKWKNLASNYCYDTALIHTYWIEIKSSHSGNKRHYHNLEHIYAMLHQAELYAEKIQDYDSLCFAIWFHDIVYNSVKSNNEEKSAEIAFNRLKFFKLSDDQLKKIERFIISTKAHEILLKENTDNAYLLDFDLSILGSSWEVYKEYTDKIRREYAIYPDFIYNKGRKKVLQHFLERENLYFTVIYRSINEAQARKNIRKELQLL